MEKSIGGYGIKIRMNEETLTVKDLLKIINNKHIDCINFNKCNDAFVKYELKSKPRSDINWKCPFLCDKYEPSLEIKPHKIYDFTNEEIQSVEDEINSMNDTQLFRLMSSIFSGKQNFEKFNGDTIEERYSANDSKVRRTRRKRFNESQKQN
jgi:hypothetical protein